MDGGLTGSEMGQTILQLSPEETIKSSQSHREVCTTAEEEEEEEEENQVSTQKSAGKSPLRKLVSSFICSEIKQEILFKSSSVYQSCRKEHFGTNNKKNINETMIIWQ